MRLPLYPEWCEVGILTDDEAWLKKIEETTASGAVRSAEAVMDIFVKTGLKVSLADAHVNYSTFSCVNPLTWNLSSSNFFSGENVSPLLFGLAPLYHIRHFLIRTLDFFSFDGR